MKRLIKLVLFLAALQVVITVVGKVLKWRFLNQQIGEGEINVVAVIGGAEEKVTSTDFRGGYLRVVMGGAELDLSEAAIEDPPATIEMTIVMGGVEITVPEDWNVRVDTGISMGGVDDIHVHSIYTRFDYISSNEDELPDLVLTGKVVMGGVAINHKKTEEAAESV